MEKSVLPESFFHMQQMRGNDMQKGMSNFGKKGMRESQESVQDFTALSWKTIPLRKHLKVQGIC